MNCINNYNINEDLDENYEDIKAVQVDVLNSNYSLESNNTSNSLLNFLQILNVKPKPLKKESTPSDEMIASSSSEILSHITDSSAQSKNYINIDLERRKLSMVEQFQVFYKKILILVILRRL